jgi:hypothetical protein
VRLGVLLRRHSAARPTTRWMAGKVLVGGEGHAAQDTADSAEQGPSRVGAHTGGEQHEGMRWHREACWRCMQYEASQATTQS